MSDDVEQFEIQLSDHLLRRAPLKLTSLDAEGRRIPELAALKMDPDGVSMFDLEVLVDGGDGPADVGTLGDTRPPQLVFSGEVAAAIRLGLGVQSSADRTTRIGYAHASVVKLEGMTEAESKEARTDLGKLMELVWEPAAQT